MRPLDHRHGFWPLVRPKGAREFLRAVVYWLVCLLATIWFTYIVLGTTGVLG